MQHGHFPVCFQHGVVYLADFEISLFAQAFQKIVCGHSAFFKHVAVDFAVVDEDNGLAVDEFSEAVTFDCEKRQEIMQYHKREYRDYAVNYRNSIVRHRNARKVCRDESYRKLEGLELGQLPLSHKPHRRQQEKVQYYCAN